MINVIAHVSHNTIHRFSGIVELNLISSHVARTIHTYGQHDIICGRTLSEEKLEGMTQISKLEWRSFNTPGQLYIKPQRVQPMRTSLSESDFCPTLACTINSSAWMNVCSIIGCVDSKYRVFATSFMCCFHSKITLLFVKSVAQACIVKIKYQHVLSMIFLAL